MPLPSGDIVQEISGTTDRAREFLVMATERPTKRQSAFCSIYDPRSPPTLTETAFGSHPCCVVSVTYVRTHIAFTTGPALRIAAYVVNLIIKEKRARANATAFWQWRSWLRGADLNRRPLGYAN